MGRRARLVAASVNDELAAAVTAHPARFKGFAMLGMKEPAKAAAELERCVTRLGFVGAMINGTTGGKFLDAEEFLPVLEAAVQLKVPIYLHPAPPPAPVKQAYFSDLPEAVAQVLQIAGWQWHAEMGLHTLRMICKGVFDRLPELQVIIGHMGEGLPYAMARRQRDFERAGQAGEAGCRLLQEQSLDDDERLLHAGRPLTCAHGGGGA